MAVKVSEEYNFYSILGTESHETGLRFRDVSGDKSSATLGQ